MGEYHEKSKEELIAEIHALRQKLENEIGRFSGLSFPEPAEPEPTGKDELYRVLFSRANDAILLLSGGRIQEFNQRAIEIFQGGVDYLHEKTILDISPVLQEKSQSSVLRWRNLIADLERGKNDAYPWTFQRKDGSLLQTEVSANRIGLSGVEQYCIFIRDLSDQIHLLETQERLREEQNLTRTGNWVIDIEKLQAMWSESMFQIHKIARTAPIPTLREYHNRFVDPDSKEVFSRLFNRAIHNGKPFESDITLRLADNEQRFVQLVARPVTNNEGQVIKIFGTCMDITDRKQLELQLLESREGYKMLVEHLPEGVVIYTDEKIFYANRGAYEMVQMDPDQETETGSVYQFILPQYKKEVKRKIALIYKGKALGPVEMKLARRDGRVIDIEARSSLVWFKGKRCIQAIFSDISYRKKVERDLRERERQLSTLISNLPGMAYRCKNDPRWTMEFLSNGAEKLTGYRVEDLVMNRRKSYNDLILEADQERVWKTVQKAVEQNEPFKVSYRICRKDGEVCFVSEIGRGVFDEKKELIALEGFVYDETERMLAQAELSNSREGYKNLVDFIPTGILIHDRGKVLFANQRVMNIFGFNSQEEIIGKSVFQYILKEYHDSIIRRVEASWLREEQIFIQLKAFTIKGDLVELEAKSLPFVYEGRKCVLVVLNDLAEAKLLQRETIRAELAEDANLSLRQEIGKRERIQRTLEKSESYIRSIINSSLDMIISNDENGYITEFNSAAEKAFLFKKQEILGKHTSMLFMRKEQFEMVSKGLTKKGYFSGEITNVDKQGNPFEAFLTATVLKDATGNVIGMMGVSRDLTQMQEARRKLRSSEESYRAIFQQAFIGIVKISLEGTLEQVNPHLLSLMEYEAENFLGLKVEDLAHPDDVYFLRGILKSLLAGKDIQRFFELRLISSNNRIISFMINLSIVRDDWRKPLFYVAIFHDLSQQQQAQKKLFEQQAKLNAILESNSHLVFSVGRDNLLSSYNSSMRDLIKKVYGVDAFVGLDMTAEEMISSDERNRLWLREIAEAFKGINRRFETHFVDPMGRRSDWEVFLNPVFSAEGKTLEVAGVGHDITEKKLRELQMAEQAARIKSFYESTSSLIYTLNSDFVLTGFNEVYQKVTERDFGKTPTVGRMIIEDVREHFPEKEFNYFVDAHLNALRGIAQQYDYKIYDPFGNAVYYHVSLDPVRRPDGSIREVLYLSSDITEARQAQKKIIQSLREKEILIKEIHHRVKNNLQVVSSMLNLQRSYLTDPDFTEVFNEIQNRVKSMSFIHEILYNTEDFSTLDFRRYLQELISNLKQSYSGKTGNKEVSLEAEDVMLDLDQSIPCGLIITELLSNAFKYAFEPKTPGRVNVSISEKDDIVVLEVKDNGKGMPAGFKISEVKSLGLQLVESLVMQLDGKLDLPKSQKGTTFRITFQKNRIKPLHHGEDEHSYR